MTLTNYLLVSAVMIVMLYGIGLGLLGDVHITTSMLIALGWLATEIAFSTWWLKGHRYGPVEWLWRRMVVGR